MIRMVDIDDFLPDLLDQAPTVPQPMAYRHIRDCARQLCSAGLLWREWDEFTVSTPESEGICTIQDAAIVKIEVATLDLVPLDPVTTAWLDMNVSGWAEYVEDAAPARYITQLNPNTITIVPKATGTLKVRLALMPSRDALELPSFLQTDHGKTIGRGAAGYCQLTPGLEFTNPQLGAANVAWFEEKLANMRTSGGQRGQHRAPVRTRARFM